MFAGLNSFFYVLQQSIGGPTFCMLFTYFSEFSVLAPIGTLYYTFMAKSGYGASTMELTSDDNFNLVFYTAVVSSIIEILLSGVTFMPIYSAYKLAKV